MPDRFLKSSACSGFPKSVQKIGGVGGNPKRCYKFHTFIKTTETSLISGGINPLSEAHPITFALQMHVVKHKKKGERSKVLLKNTFTFQDKHVTYQVYFLQKQRNFQLDMHSLQAPFSHDML